MPTFLSPLVERAFRVAAAAHADDVRKSSNVPYIAHPAAVAVILSQAGFDAEEILAAALLHDVIEDTSYSVEQLRNEFPAAVADVVLACSEQKLDEEGRKRPWEDRKREHLDAVAAAPLEARAVVLADKLHNLISMVYDVESGTELWSRFNAPRERILWYQREMIARASGEDERLAPLVEECRRQLAILEAKD